MNEDVTYIKLCGVRIALKVFVYCSVRRCNWHCRLFHDGMQLGTFTDCFRATRSFPVFEMECLLVDHQVRSRVVSVILVHESSSGQILEYTASSVSAIDYCIQYQTMIRCVRG